MHDSFPLMPALPEVDPRGLARTGCPCAPDLAASRQDRARAAQYAMRALFVRKPDVVENECAALGFGSGRFGLLNDNAFALKPGHRVSTLAHADLHFDLIDGRLVMRESIRESQGATHEH